MSARATPLRARARACTLPRDQLLPRVQQGPCAADGLPGLSFSWRLPGRPRRETCTRPTGTCAKGGAGPFVSAVVSARAETKGLARFLPAMPCGCTVGPADGCGARARWAPCAARFSGLALTVAAPPLCDEQVPSWSEFLTRDDAPAVTNRGHSGRFFLVTTR